MPRAFDARTTFVCATASLFPTLAYAGYVPIGAVDVAPEATLSDTQALVGEVLAEKQVSFSIDDWTTGEVLLAGTVEQRVIMEAEKQSLTFHYLITDTLSAEGSGEIFRASVFSFGELVQTDVGYLVDDAAEGSPSRIGRTNEAVDAHFDGAAGVLDDGDAISFFVRTNAKTFDTSGLFALDALAPQPDPIAGSRVRTAVAEGLYRAVVTEGPVAVPLPGPVWTGIIGLGTAAWVNRRRRAKR